MGIQNGGTSRQCLPCLAGQQLKGIVPANGRCRNGHSRILRELQIIPYGKLHVHDGGFRIQRDGTHTPHGYTAKVHVSPLIQTIRGTECRMIACHVAIRPLQQAQPIGNEPAGCQKNTAAGNECSATPFKDRPHRYLEIHAPVC